MYFDTSILRSRRAILFQRLLPKLGSQAHFNTMFFSFAAKMAADTNQLKEQDATELAYTSETWLWKKLIVNAEE